MRKPLLYSNPKYYKLLNKYRNLYARLKNMLRDGSYFSLEDRIKKSLYRKFKLLYQRIGKMQLAMGIKTAGIAMSFMLVSNIVDAQMPKKLIENEAGTALFNSGISNGSRSIAKFVDIDNDGDEDLFLGGRNESYISKGSSGTFTYKFFENKGKNANELFVDADNELDPVLPISNTSYYPPFIDFIDNDGDGDLDVFAVNPNMCGDIDYYKNIGTQSAPKFQLTTGSENTFDGLYGSFSIAFEDIDLDDDLDAIITTNMCGTVRYFENNAGVFNEKTGTQNPFTDLSLYYTALDFQDMDGDGDVDAIAGDNCYGIRYLENIPVCGEPHFLVNYCDNPIDQSGYEFYPSFADLDEDNDMDLIVSDYGSELIDLTYHENLNNSFTNLGATPMIDLPIGLNSKECPIFIDLDGDGDLDMYVDDKSYQLRDRVYKNIGNNSHPVLKRSTLDNFGLPKPYYYETEAFVDIDNDGDLDLFIVPYNYSYMPPPPPIKKVKDSKPPLTNPVKFYKNIGTSTNPDYELQDQSNNPLSAFYSNGYINGLSFADLDKDGDFDAVLGNEYDDPTLTVLKNTGTKEAATFVEVNYSSNPFEGITDTPYNIAFADFDGDGDQDLIFGTQSSYILKSSGTGAFLLFDNISDQTEINFEAITGLENPLDTFNMAYGNFAFTKLFNEDEVSFIIREMEDIPVKKSANFDITRYYSYKDLLSMQDKSVNINENTQAGTTVTALEAEYYGDENISYSIESGNTSSAFIIDNNNLLVNNPDALDYEIEANRIINLNIKASDGTYETTATYTVNVLDVIEAGIEKAEADQLKVYPNPASSEINLEIGSEFSGSVHVRLFNSVGNLVQDKTFENTKCTLNVSDLNSGIYFIQVKSDVKTVTKKVMIK